MLIQYLLNTYVLFSVLALLYPRPCGSLRPSNTDHESYCITRRRLRDFLLGKPGGPAFSLAFLQATTGLLEKLIT